jgi:pimeloyl-ACP methyl ester carboxylesterase
MNVRRLLAAFGLAIAQFGDATAQTTKVVPDYGDILSLAKPSASQDQATSARFLDLEEAFKIAFIPGILGSRLEIDGFIFGEHPVKVERLVYRKGSKAKATTLNTFTPFIGNTAARVEFWKTDIYGQALDELQQALESRHIEEYAYDWREDIDATAQDFQKWAQRFAGKKVVIVAHSMGGIVAWHWKHRYAASQRPFKLIGLVVLGSPLLGTCEAGRMLIQGYKAPRDSPSWEKWATDNIFGQAHAAVLTFPSVYQLLPAFDRERPCIVTRRVDGTYSPQNHHSIDLWLGREGGKSGLLGAGGKKLKELARQANMSEKEYRDAVEYAVGRGHSFRQKFKPKLDDDDHVILLYSEYFRVTRRVTVGTDTGGWYWIKEFEVDSGDGRVPTHSAKNETFFDPLKASRYRLDLDHGDLPKDPEFGTIVRDNVVPLIQRLKTIQAATIVATDSKLTQQALKANWVFEPGVPSNALWADPDFSKARGTLASFNLVSVAGESNVNPTLLKAYSKLLVSSTNPPPRAQDEAVAAALFESALILESLRYKGPSDVRSAHALGTMLLRQNRRPEALRYLSLAANGILFEPSVWDDRLLTQGTFTALASGYEDAGAASAAAETSSFARNKASNPSFWKSHASSQNRPAMQAGQLPSRPPGTVRWEQQVITMGSKW